MMGSCRRLLFCNNQQLANPYTTVTSGVAAALYQLHNHTTSFKRYYSDKGDLDDEEHGVKIKNDDDDPYIYIDQERAPSTADMFKKVEKEMSRQAQVAEDKAYEAASTAKEAGPGENYPRKE